MLRNNLEKPCVNDAGIRAMVDIRLGDCLELMVDTAKEDALSKSLRAMAEEMQNEDTE